MTSIDKKISHLLLKASFIGTFAETMLAPFWAVLTEKVGGSLLDAGFGFAVFCIVNGIIVMTFGQTKFFERNVHKLVFWGLLIAGIGDLSYILVSNKWELWLVQIIIGLSVGILNPAWDAIYAEDDDGNTHAQKWSFWSGGVNFATGVAAIVGSVLIKYLGFKWLFVGMFVADLLPMYYALQVWRNYEVSTD
jgi:MFS family permease